MEELQEIYRLKINKEYRFEFIINKSYNDENFIILKLFFYNELIKENTFFIHDFKNLYRNIYDSICDNEMTGG